jgi:hypothetical protein
MPSLGNGYSQGLCLHLENEVEWWGLSAADAKRRSSLATTVCLCLSPWARLSPPQGLPASPSSSPRPLHNLSQTRTCTSACARACARTQARTHTHMHTRVGHYHPGVSFVHVTYCFHLFVSPFPRDHILVKGHSGMQVVFRPDGSVLRT